LKLGRRKRKARAIESRHDRRVELLGYVGTVAGDKVFVDELWDAWRRVVDRPLCEDAVFSIQIFGRDPPKTGPFGDSFWADTVRVWGERSSDGKTIRILRVKACKRSPLTLTRSQRNTLRLAGKALARAAADSP